MRLLTWGALLSLCSAPSSQPAPPRLEVDSERIMLVTTSGYQTVSMRDGGPTGLYYDAATDLLRGRADVRSVVLLGLGGGEMLRQAHRVQPQAMLVGVELDPTVAHLARTTFEVPGAVVEADAIGWVDVPAAGSYSVVVVDLYNDSEMVPAASRLTFLAACFRLLSPGGLFIMNVWPAYKADEVSRVLDMLYPAVHRRTYDANVILYAEKPVGLAK